MRRAEDSRLEDHNVAVEEIVQNQRRMFEMGGMDASRFDVNEIFFFGRFTEDSLRQGPGEAIGVVSCCVFVAVGERRPLPSRTPIESSFVAIAGVFVARCDTCPFGRSARHKLPNGPGALAHIFESESEYPGNHVHAEMVEDSSPRKGTLQFVWPC